MEPGYTAPRTIEQSPALPPVSPEVVPGVSHETAFEQSPQNFEREQSPPPAAPPTPVQQVQAPVLPPTVDDNALAADATAALLTSLPSVASDDDLIEKEWVNKAKHIIAETADDPYRRERAIKELQRDYLRKRYNKEMGATE
jgi:hypothetical protein